MTSHPWTWSPRAASRPEQPAADDDGLHARARALEQRPRVLERAEGKDAVLVQPVDRRHPGGTAGGQQQRVVGRDAAVAPGHRLRDRVDVNDADADAEIDAVALIPLDGVEHDVVRGLLAGENGRQHDAVVIDVRLVAEDRDLESRRVLQDLLEAGHARHAVSDHDEALHREPRWYSQLPIPNSQRLCAFLEVGSWELVVDRSTRTADCL